MPHAPASGMSCLRPDPVSDLRLYGISESGPGNIVTIRCCFPLILKTTDLKMFVCQYGKGSNRGACHTMSRQKALPKSQHKIIDNWQMCELNFQTICRQSVKKSVAVPRPLFALPSLHPQLTAVTLPLCRPLQFLCFL